MSWPISLLNASNRRLEEEIKDLSAKLQSKLDECGELKESTALLQENLQLVQRQRNVLEKELMVKRENLESDTSRLKIIHNECDGAQRTAKYLDDTCKRLEFLVKEQDAAINQHRQLLYGKMNESKLLEEEAKTAALIYLSKQKQGEALQAEVKGLSFSVWAKLERLHKEIAAKEASLHDAREEHTHLLRELDATQSSLSYAVQSQRQLVETLESVHRQRDLLDECVLHNSEAMSTLKEREAAKVAEQQKLIDTLNKLQLNNKTLLEENNVKQANLSKAIASLRDTTRFIHEGAHMIEMLKRQHRMESDKKNRLIEELKNQNLVIEVGRKTLLSHNDHLARLNELSNSTMRGVGKLTPSLTALHSMQRMLEHVSTELDERLLLMQSKMSDILSNFACEGQRSDTVQADIVARQRAISECTKELEQLQQKHHLADTALCGLDTRIAEVREGLLAAQATAASLRVKREAELKLIVDTERQRLLEVVQVYRRLLHDLTTLRSQVRGIRHGELAQRQASLEKITETHWLMGKEVPNLEAELAELEQHERQGRLQARNAEVTLHALRSAARDQGGALKQAVGVEEHLRAQLEVEQSRMEADQRALLLEYHLLQNASREQAEELRRHHRRRDLLRARYEEVMASLAKGTQAPSLPPPRTRQTLDSAALALPEMDASAPPEALHARMLLQRSYEREHLMQRGNFLDMRVLSMERETEGLRRLLDATKAETQVFQLKKRDGAAVTPATLPERRDAETPSGTGTASNKKVDSMQDGPSARSHMLHVEIKRQESLIGSLQEQHGSLRARVKELRKTLASAQVEKKQKHMQLQRLEDALRRRHQKGSSYNTV